MNKRRYLKIKRKRLYINCTQFEQLPAYYLKIPKVSVKAFLKNKKIPHVNFYRILNALSNE